MSSILVALLGTAAFSALFILNLVRTKSFMNPSVAIAAVWAVTFLFFDFSGDRFYGVSSLALCIFIVGVGAFSIGTTIGESVPVTVRVYRNNGTRRDRVILIALLLILIAGIPVYIEQLRQFSNAPLLSAQFFLAVRHGTLVRAATVERVPIVNNLVVLSLIAAVFGYAVSGAAKRYRFLIVSLIMVAFFYNVLTTSKTGIFQLVIMLFTIHALQRGHVPWKSLVVAMAALFVGFGVVTIMRDFGGGGGSLADLLVRIWQRFGNYWASGPMAFSAYLDNPMAVDPVWSPWRFFEHTADYFGNFFDVPDLNAQYVAIGDGLYYNVYTAFFSYYPPYGVAGVMAFMLFIGLIAGIAYTRAKQQRIIWQLFYASILYGICMTIFNESLLLALNPMLKLIICTLIFLFLRRVRLSRKIGDRGELSFA